MGALTGKRALVTCGSRGIGRPVVERLARDGAAVVFSLVEHGPPPTRLLRPSGPQAGRRGGPGRPRRPGGPCGDCSRRPDGAWAPSTSWSTRRGRAADAHRSDDRGGVRPRLGSHAKGVFFAIRHACARAGGSSSCRPSRPCCRRQHGDLQRQQGGGRAVHAKTVEAFTARMREQLDLDSLTAELLAVVDRTEEPAQVPLWLRSARKPRLSS
jgi:hypothetical protein